jgi:hypothetical protein
MVLEAVEKLILTLGCGYRAHFIDTGDHATKTIWFYVRKKTFKFRNGEYAINKNKINNRRCYYHTNFAEPLDFEFSGNKTLYFIRSDEFKNAMQNKVMQMLLYIHEKKLIQFILIITGLILALTSMIYLNDMGYIDTVANT